MIEKVSVIRINGLPPSVNSLYIRSKKRVFKSQAGKKYEKKVLKILTKRPRIESPIALVIEYHIRTSQKFKRRDLDNMDKCLIDSLQLSGQFRNDNQIVFRAGIKLQDKSNYVLVHMYTLISCNFDVFELMKKLST